MSSNFPTSIDAFNNPTGTDALGNPTVLHSEQHSNVNDAVENIETKVGTDNSSDANSLDFAKNFMFMINNQIATGAYKETTPSADPFPTLIIWYTNSFKTIKLVDKSITYNANRIPTTIVYRLYNGTVANTVLKTITDTITYSGVFETSRSRTIS